MLYDHSETLKHVAPEDVTHVKRMLAKLDAYARSGGRAPLGMFLTSLVVGDLFVATAHADDVNVKYLSVYTKYVYNHLPDMHVHLARDVLAIIRRLVAEESAPLTHAHVSEEVVAFYTRIKERLRREEPENAGSNNA